MTKKYILHYFRKLSIHPVTPWSLATQHTHANVRAVEELSLISGMTFRVKWNISTGIPQTLRRSHYGTATIKSLSTTCIVPQAALSVSWTKEPAIRRRSLLETSTDTPPFGATQTWTTRERRLKNYVTHPISFYCRMRTHQKLSSIEGMELCTDPISHWFLQT